MKRPKKDSKDSKEAEEEEEAEEAEEEEDIAVIVNMAASRTKKERHLIPLNILHFLRQLL